MQYEVVESKYGPDQWCAEAVNYPPAGEGEIYGTLFYGPDAKKRAQAYAKWAAVVASDLSPEDLGIDVSALQG